MLALVWTIKRYPSNVKNTTLMLHNLRLLNKGVCQTIVRQGLWSKPMKTRMWIVYSTLDRGVNVWLLNKRKDSSARGLSWIEVVPFFSTGNVIASQSTHTSCVSLELSCLWVVINHPQVTVLKQDK